MKKIMAAILCLMLLCTAGLAEETSGKAVLGTISVNGAFTLQCGVPEGYTPKTLLESPDHMIVLVSSEKPEAPEMYLSVAFDETYSDVDRMNDLDAEARALLEETFTRDDPLVEITYGETGYGTELLVARHDTEYFDYISFLSVYKGYFIEFVLAPGRRAVDKNLTDEMLRTCVDFLTELDFIPVEESPEAAPAAYTAIPGAYHEDTGLLELVLKTPEMLQASFVQNELKVGAVIELGGQEVEVSSLTSDEYFPYTINEEYFLEPSGDPEWYRVLTYNDAPVLKVYAEIGAKVSDNTVFYDHIDPESGEMLDRPTRYTFAEFLAMRDSEAEGVGPGFAEDNTVFTLDAEMNLLQIDREYVPWQ